MTLKEIEALDKDFLTVQEVAECLHMNCQLIRDQATRNQKWLGFPTCQAGRSFRFPRKGFLAWAYGETPMLVYDQSVHKIPSFMPKVLE